MPQFRTARFLVALIGAALCLHAAPTTARADEYTDRLNRLVNDPASPDDASVKHYYDRQQFEEAWIPASGGIVYVDRPAGWWTPPLTANNS